MPGKNEYVGKVARHKNSPPDAPSIMEFPTISLTGEAPDHIQARVLEESRANQAYLAELRAGH